MDTVDIPLLDPGSLWRSWFLWVTAGEAAGFVVPAVTGVLTRDSHAAVAYAGLILAGLVEGAALGWVQAHVFARVLTRLDVRRFAGHTSLAAGLAYAITMAPTLVADELGAWPVTMRLGLMVILGCALLASIGTAQWLVLRDCLPHTSSWILTTAGSWLVGLGVFFGIATPLWHEGQATWLTVLIGMAGGLVMAAVVAALTGLAMLRLLRRHRPAALEGRGPATSATTL